jgi:rhodanese-related sulfurtransferase
MNQLLEFTNAHPLLMTGTVLMGLAVLFYEIRHKAGDVAAISAAQAVRLINQGGRVVDVRGEAEYKAGHIVDAINIPAAEIGEEPPRKLKNSKSVILVCENGAKSGSCATTLRKAGIENTFSLRGGLAAWLQDNLPVVKAENT